MDDTIFAISKVGASHLPKGVPCQDYSLCYDEDGIRMIIVCDGHGSSTYVRSDVGAKLAAEIAKEEILGLCVNHSEYLFKGRSGAVTARPLTIDNLWGEVSKKSVEDMSDDERESYEQEKAFYEQVKEIKEQDGIMYTLFVSICERWKAAIREDCENNTFTETELNALGSNRIEKAYGTTLMAYVETESYWFAFHIGDGRIVAVDRHIELTNPVPWDCRCFQNMTTSLCNSNPQTLFRYAFDGTGNFPEAVFCCSDGIEDSYGDYSLSSDRLHQFYVGLLREFSTKGEEITLKNIEDFLPILSEKGSKDDMSLAAIIHIEGLTMGWNEYELRQRIKELGEKKEQEIKKYDDEINDLLMQADSIKTEIDLHYDRRQ